MWKRCNRNMLPDAFGDNFRLDEPGLRQQNAKLFSTVTQRHVSRPKRILQTMCSYLQSQVTRYVTILIVVIFEIVDVDHQEADRVIVALGTVQLLRQSFLQVPQVRQTS